MRIGQDRRHCRADPSTHLTQLGKVHNELGVARANLYRIPDDYVLALLRYVAPRQAMMGNIVGGSQICAFHCIVAGHTDTKR